MRISLLLEREPFPRILERTLARFWGEQYGREFSVTWQPLTLAGRRESTSTQSWLVNAYLNAIFRPDAEPAIFDPIRREYTHSPVVWRRVVQPACVRAALSRTLASRFAQAQLIVDPPVPDAEHKLIVAGNHKIRLLDWQEQRAYAICKDGFNQDFLAQEIAVRRQAECLGLPIPAMYEVSAEHSWFSEAYTVGTPVNRLSSQAAAGQATATAMAALRRLAEATQEVETVAGYVQQLQHEIDALVQANHLLTSAQRQEIGAHTTRLAEDAVAPLPPPHDQIVLALAHGDFQPGNVLVHDDITLIDWEYAGRRFAAYDLLVWSLAARFPSGLAERLYQFVMEGWQAELLPEVEGWPGLTLANASNAMRRRLSHFFLLEELNLHLLENSQPDLIQLGQGLRILLHELVLWWQYWDAS